jgi:hypothetical protein
MGQSVNESDELEQALELIAKHAPMLRRHVATFRLGDISVEFRAPDMPIAPHPSDAAARTQDQMPADPLDDPMSYPGGYVPRLPNLDAQIHAHSSGKARREPDEHEDDDDA